MTYKKMIFLGTAVLLMILTACATTKLSGTWKDESLSGKKFQKLLVIGAAKQQQARELFEDEFVRQLEAQGVKAIPSYTLIPAEKMLDKETIVSHIAENSIDAVLITRLTGSRVSVQRIIPFPRSNGMGTGIAAKARTRKPVFIHQK